MATLAPQPKFQFFDNNGNPLSGGRLYTYVAGTTTPQATYTDETGTVTNTNPVILDSRGEANVWFGPGTYKLKLATAADVEVWSVDGIGSQLSVADLATGIQTWLGNPTSANLRAAMVDETGTGALVFANAPTLVLPNVDVINEATPAVGVTVDGVLLKDNDVDADSVVADDVSAPILNATGTSSSGGIVRLYEDTDTGTNYVQLTAPTSLSANRVLTLPDTVGADGDVMRSNGSGVLSFASTLITKAVLTGSGQTALEFFDIPAWVKRITISVNGISSSSNANIQVQLGDSGGFETTSYSDITMSGDTAPAIGVGAGAAGFPFINLNSNLYSHYGHILLTLIDASTNTWVCSGTLTASGSTFSVLGGSKALSATLDRVRLYIDGTATFDAGTVNILYE